MEVENHPATRAGIKTASEFTSLLEVADSDAPEQKLQRFIEQAVDNCGSAAELARRLKVTPATVSQWRSRLKRPDAIHLIRIQGIASRGSLIPIPSIRKGRQ